MERAVWLSWRFNFVNTKVVCASTEAAVECVSSASPMKTKAFSGAVDFM